MTKIFETIFSVKNEYLPTEDFWRKTKKKYVMFLGKKFYVDSLILAFIPFPPPHTHRKSEEIKKLYDYYRVAIYTWYTSCHTPNKKYHQKAPSIWWLMFRYSIKKKPTLVFIHHYITTHCTLKCKECTCYVPYYDTQERRTIPFEQFKEELDELLNGVDKIYQYSFMGGEPLLCKDLPKMVEYACSKKQIKFATITSNGTVIPTEELAKVLEKNNKKVKLNISNYSSNEKLKNKLKHDEIISVLDKYKKVKYEILPTEKTFWHSKIKVCKEKFGEEIQRYNSKMCYTTNCKILADGYIHICPLSYYMATKGFNVLNSAVSIINNKNLVSDTLKFLTERNYEPCGYCNTNEIVPVSVAEQL